MKQIDSFEQLREVVEAFGTNIKKPLRALVVVTMITVIQLRKIYSIEAEARYAECQAAGETWPAIKGLFDLAIPALYCYDGEHRLKATIKNGKTHIVMELAPGTEREAVLKAAGENDTHGVDRQEDDTRNIIMTMLEDAEWGCWSSTRIAKITRTNVPMVEKYRQEREAQSGTTAIGEVKPKKRKVFRNGKEYEMKIPVKPKKDPVEVALAKIVKLVEPFAAEDRQRLVSAVLDKLKGEDTAA